MNVLMAWVVAPLMWAALSVGLGLLLQKVVRGTVPPALLVPVGFAAFVVVSTFTTAWHWSSPLTVPLLMVLAVGGLIAGRGQLARAREAISAAIAAVIVYVLYSLPVAVAGSPFAGWIKLDDGSTWLAFADRLIEAGRELDGLAPSSYEAVLQINWDGAYPVGAFPPLGAVSALLHVDAAWLLQPYIAFLAAVVALAVFHLLGPFVAHAWLRVALSVLAATPALLLGYAMWGGVKELAIASLLVVVAALAVQRLSTTALATTVAALLFIAGYSGAVWVAVPLLTWLVLVVRDRRWGSLGLLTAEMALLAIPLIVLVRPDDVRNLAGFATSSDDIGNLWGALDPAQILGIWPVGDFRATPEPRGPVYLLLAVVVVLAVIGLWQAIHRRLWALPLYLGNVMLIVAVSSFGNEWIAGKALAMSSPAWLVAAGAGVGWLWEQRRTVEAWAGLGLLTVGIAWSYVLVYHDVWLAPAQQVEELRAIGEADLPAPALMLEYSPYGVRHFLRALDAEGAGELRRRTIPTVDGGTVRKGAYADIDEISQDGLADFPTLVLRRSVTASRPASNYQLVRQGHFYDVWQRQDTPQVVRHVPFGDQTDPAVVPACRTILAVAGSVAPGERLAFVERAPVITVPLGLQGTIAPATSTQVRQSFTVEQAGTYRLALGGSFVGEVRLSINDQQVWTGEHQINWTGNVTPTGHVTLEPGTHELTLDYELKPLRPGVGGDPWPMGPIYLSLTDDGTPVQFANADEARELCGRRLDWLEVVRS